MSYCGRCGTFVGEATTCPSCSEPMVASAPPPAPPPPPPGWGAPVTGGAPVAPPSDVNGKKIAAGVLGIVLGSLGIHKFVLGYTGAGVAMLLITVLTCGLGGIVTGIIGLIEGIIYLTKSDEEFDRTYVAGRRAWF